MEISKAIKKKSRIYFIPFFSAKENLFYSILFLKRKCRANSNLIGQVKHSHKETYPVMMATQNSSKLNV